MNQTIYNTKYINSKAAADIIGSAKTEYLVDRPLRITTINDARVIPASFAQFHWNIYGGVFYPDGTVCEDSIFCEGMQGVPEGLDDTYEYDDSKVIYCGNFYNCWGHVLTDDIKKLWFVVSPYGKALIEAGYKLIYISPDNIETCANAFRLFQLIGVDTDILTRVSRQTIFKEVVVPESCYFKLEDRHLCTREYIDTITRVKSQIDAITKPKRHDKVYLTRVAFNKAKDYGEKAVEDLFRSEGYEIISPETLALENQISLMMHTLHIAMTEGSISHNIVFCSPGTKVVILRKVEYHNNYQFLINSIIDSEIIYIDAHHSVMASKESPNEGPFYLSVTSELLSFFGIKEKPKRYWITKEFVSYVFDNLKIVDYTRKLLPLLRTPAAERRKIIRNKFKRLFHR